MNELEGRGRALRAGGRPDGALEDFKRVADFSAKNREAPHTYPEWK